MPKLGRRTEHQPWDYMNGDRWSSMNAPFGTSDQPPTRVKIIGGKRVLVSDNRKFISPRLDEQPVISPSPAEKVRPNYGYGRQLTSRSSALPRLEALTEKPNNFDPTPYVVHSRHHSSPGYISLERGNHNLQLSGISIPGRESVQSNLNPHKVIPPIPSENRRQSPRKERHTGPPQASNRTTADNEVTPSVSHDLSYLLPHDAELPKDPLELSKEDELELRKLIGQEFEGFNPKKLQDIYLELAGFDHQLTGFVRFQDLSYSLLKSQVKMKILHLRLMASLFVSPESPGNVNYEKVLSFIVASMNDAKGNREKGERLGKESLSPGQNVQRDGISYNPITHQEEDNRIGIKHVHDVDVSISPQSNRFPYGDRDNAKLLRLIEDQLLAAEDPLNWERIWATFQAADRQHRGKFSRQQIAELSNLCQIPLQASIVNNIIDKCDTSNGQYNWQQYLGFIERVQPHKTGLNIPDSKKPLEFAKHFPSPSINWPANSSDPLTTPGRYPALPLTPKSPQEGSSDSSPKQMQIKSSPKEEVHQSQKKQETIMQIEREIEQLEEERMRAEKRLKAEKTGPAVESESEPWFERFMKMAKAMYSNDAGHSGYLSREEVLWLAKEYNTVYNLGFGESVVEQALETSIERGRVKLDTLLHILGVQGQ